MSQPIYVVRPARIDDAPAVAAVYAPYVLDTAVLFEEDPPPDTAMAQRIADTLPTYP